MLQKVQKKTSEIIHFCIMFPPVCFGMTSTSLYGEEV